MSTFYMFCDDGETASTAVTQARDARKPWGRIDIVTYADRLTSLNPVVPALMRENLKEKLKGNVYVHTVSRCLPYFHASGGRRSTIDRLNPIFVFTVCCGRTVSYRSRSASTCAGACPTDPNRHTNVIATVQII